MNKEGRIIIYLTHLMIITLGLSFGSVGCKQNRDIYNAKAVSTKGALIKLSTGQVVQLAGVYIPLGGINYRKELLANMENLIKEKNVKIEIITKVRKNYPQYPLVIVYLNGVINLNERLLKEGMALFDHGYYKGKDRLEQIEKQARKNKVGIWGSLTPPKVLFVTSRKWQGIHLADSPIVQDISEHERIEYFAMPQQMWRGRFWDYDAEYGKMHDPHQEDFIDYYYKWHKEEYKPGRIEGQVSIFNKNNLKGR